MASSTHCNDTGDPGDVRNKDVNELDLPVRCRAALDVLEIRTIGELCETTEQELLSCRNFGVVSLAAIKYKLAALGLSLAS